MKHLLILYFLLVATFCKCANFELYFPHLIKAEGLLFTITQYDKGGATKFGITYRTYRFACSRSIAKSCDKNKDGRVSVSDLALATQVDIKPIYQVMYWNESKAHIIANQAIAETICDILVNCGPGRNNANIKAIQKVVGTKQDGKIGAVTVQKINSSNAKILYKKLFEYRARYYMAIGRGSQKRFLRGWLNRIHNLKIIHENEKFI